MATFFTADLHIGHENILKFGRGAYHTSLEDMHQYIINVWNDIVGMDDEVYVLGDMFMGANKDVGSIADFTSRVRGTIHVVPGNHDNINILNAALEFSVGYNVERDIVRRKIKKSRASKGHPFVLSHYPLMSWMGQSDGVPNLHGHCHNSVQFPGKMLDVGWDGGYTINETSYGKHIWSLSDVLMFMEKRNIVTYDYH